MRRIVNSLKRTSQIAFFCLICPILMAPENWMFLLQIYKNKKHYKLYLEDVVYRTLHTIICMSTLITSFLLDLLVSLTTSSFLCKFTFCLTLCSVVLVIQRGVGKIIHVIFKRHPEGFVFWILILTVAGLRTQRANIFISQGHGTLIPKHGTAKQFIFTSPDKQKAEIYYLKKKIFYFTFA